MTETINADPSPQSPSSPGFRGCRGGWVAGAGDSAETFNSRPDAEGTPGGGRRSAFPGQV